MQPVRTKIPAVILLFVMLLQMVSCSTGKVVMKDRAGKKTTILGLGDSITEGSTDFFSYLFPLDSLLRKAGYPVKFIGPRRSVQNGDTMFHFGSGGKTAEFVAKQIDSIYALYPADIVLLHAGHNHFVEEAPVPGIIAAQKKIVQAIRRQKASAFVFIAAVITSGKLPKYSYIPELNNAIRSMVMEMQDDHVIFVDQSRDWDWAKYTIADKVHPNRDGARHIATNWFNAITYQTVKK